MWYVAQVNSGQEAAVRDMCKQMIDPAILQDAFLPEYETMRKIQGEWCNVKKLLFPGYLFLVTERLPELFAELRKAQASVRLLGKKEGSNEVMPISPQEEAWIRAMSDEAYCVRMSKGYITGDAITVTQGPLFGHEAIIRKIDRHKRRASIEVSMFGRTTTATIGLEVVRKAL